MTNSSQMKETLEDIPDFPNFSDNEFTRTPTNIYINKTTKKQAKKHHCSTLTHSQSDRTYNSQQNKQYKYY